MSQRDLLNESCDVVLQIMFLTRYASLGFVVSSCKSGNGLLQIMELTNQGENMIGADDFERCNSLLPCSAGVRLVGVLLTTATSGLDPSIAGVPAQCLGWCASLGKHPG